MRAGTVASDMTGLLLPRGCAGCDMPDEVLCPGCRALFSQVVAVPSETMRVPACACSVYEGAARRAVLAWKDHGDEECDRPFSQALCALASRIPDVIGVMGEQGAAIGADAGHGAGAGLLIVPAPSSARSVRRRGRRHMMPPARRLAAWCRTHGVRARAADVLASRVTGGKSVETKGRSGRAARVGGSVITVPRPRRVDGRRVVFVDDIVTTGATMRACVAALESAGAQVVACLALTATPRYGVSAA